MLKFVDYDIVFQEVPGEVTLAVNLSGCPCRCPGCHSPHLWGNIGKPLTYEALDELIVKCHEDITCVALMGGDAEPLEINNLMRRLKEQHKNLHTAWYSGRTLLSPMVDLSNFDYVKLGPYLAHLGALRSPRTNQRMFKIVDGNMNDITNIFWKR